MTHTQGKWKWYWHGNKAIIQSDNGNIIVNADDKAEATHEQNYGIDSKYDAQLIASAPNLLSICKEIAEDSNCDLVDSERRIRLYQAIKQAEAN